MMLGPHDVRLKTNQTYAKPEEKIERIIYEFLN